MSESAQPAVPWRHGASVVARALVPIAGVLFLHWSASNLLIVYFADTLAAFFSASVLAAGRLSGTAEASGLSWHQRLLAGLRLAASGAVVALIAGLVPFGFLAFMLAFMDDFVLHFALHDRDLWIGVGAQFCTAVTLLLREYHAIEAEADRDRIIKARFGLAFARWVAVCAVFMTAAEFLEPQRGGLGATIFGFVLVLAYAIATIFMELEPGRVLAGLGAADLVPRRAARAETDRKPSDSR